MSINLPSLALLMGIPLLIAGGCASPGRGQGDPSKTPRVASTMPAPSGLAPMGYDSAGTRPPVAAPISHAAPIAQAAPFASAAPFAQGIRPASYSVQLSDQATCGCSSCNSRTSCGCGGIGCQACCPQPPYGYAMPNGYWNAYGIDPQEFICDGGDYPPEAILRRDDTIAGLQPEDTVVHYTNEAGDIEFQASNRVCLYAPRFLSVRKITGALAGGRAVGLAQMDKPLGTVRVDQPLPGLVMTDSLELAHADVARRIDAMRERNRGVPLEGILQPEMATDVLAALVGLTIDEILALQDERRALLDKYLMCAVTWELEESLEVVVQDLKPPSLVRDENVDGLTIFEFPDAGRLQICKLADRADALPGEIVSFAIRLENVGDSAVEQVVLTDNLTTRLEYIDGSQTCSGGAVFETFANDGQSLRLQWSLTDKLEVGESVTIRFQCRVR